VTRATPKGSLRSIGVRRRLQTLGRTPPFWSFRQEILVAIATASVDREFRKGTVLFNLGEGAAAAYVVERGVVRLSTMTHEGRPVVLRFAGPADSFGLSSLLDDGPRSAEARAITDVRLVTIPAAALRSQMDRSASVSAACARHAASRLRRERSRLASLASGDVRERITSTLLELSGSHGVRVAGGTLIDVPLRHEDLAGLVGSTRETVTRSLAVLAGRGLLRRLDTRYVVLDPPAAMATERGP
jgi:CRP/FNR family transcriptional regulator, cyclic AMP receptor protein